MYRIALHSSLPGWRNEWRPRWLQHATLWLTQLNVVSGSHHHEQQPTCFSLLVRTVNKAVYNTATCFLLRKITNCVFNLTEYYLVTRSFCYRLFLTIFTPIGIWKCGYLRRSYFLTNVCTCWDIPHPLNIFIKVSNYVRHNPHLPKSFLKSYLVTFTRNHNCLYEPSKSGS